MVSVSAMKALKRQRQQYVASEDCFDESHFQLAVLPDGPHAPSKREARVLRRLSAQTGLAESQLRERKTYRQQIAAAIKPRAGRHPAYTYARALRKAVTARTGLHPQHPEFAAAFEAAWKDRIPAQRDANLTASQALELSLLKPNRR